MTKYRISGGGTSTYTSLIWAMLLFLVGAFLFLSSLSSPSLLTWVYLLLVAFSMIFIVKSMSNIRESHCGDYVTALDVGETISIEYRNGRTEMRRYDEVSYVGTQKIADMVFLRLEFKDGGRHTLSLADHNPRLRSSPDPYRVAEEIRKKT